MLIGSRAIAHWNKDFKVKPNSDWDIIGEGFSLDEDTYWRKKLNIPQEDLIEWHDPYFLNNDEMINYASLDNFEVCSRYGLAIIYRSHLHRDYKFDSHITKYHKFILPMLGVTEAHLENDDYKDRVKLTKQYFKQGNPNLNQSNDDFFDDKVTKVFEHDYIHELFAYEQRPMFERLKHSGEEDSAWCAKDLWDGLTTTQKLQCVAEEVQVISVERFLLKENPIPAKLAYFTALKKVCTTLCSGWFRDYAIDSYPAIVGMFDKQRIDNVVNQLKKEM